MARLPCRGLGFQGQASLTLARAAHTKILEEKSAFSSFERPAAINAAYFANFCWRWESFNFYDAVPSSAVGTVERRTQFLTHAR